MARSRRRSVLIWVTVLALGPARWRASITHDPRLSGAVVRGARTRSDICSHARLVFTCVSDARVQARLHSRASPWKQRSLPCMAHAKPLLGPPCLTLDPGAAVRVRLKIIGNLETVHASDTPTFLIIK